MRAEAVAALAAALLYAGAGPLGAEGPRIVSLEECLWLGSAASADLRTAELEAGAADARVSEARRQLLPSVSVQGGYARLSDVAPGSITSDISLPPPIGTKEMTVDFPAPLQNSTSLRVTVQQPLFTGLRISASVRQAEAMRDSSRQDLAKSGLDLRYAIQEAYWSLAKAKAQVRAMRESVTQMEAHLADASKLFDQGLVTRNDTLQAEMRLEDARIERTAAESVLALARVNLAQAIGLEWNADIDIDDAPTAGPPQAPSALAALVSRAQASRPEIRSAFSRVGAQEIAVDAALSGLYPSVFLTGDYTLADPNPRVFPQTDLFVGTWSVGVMATIDIGRYPLVLAQADQARARLAQAREAARKLSDAVTADVVRAYLALDEATLRYASLRSETGQAEENNRVVRERYRQGIALSSESLDAEAMFIRAKSRESGALYDCLIARAALDRAVGE
jgi:outer membrane protein